ncbi:MAG: 2-phosphosulfolactate phosphatase [Chthoniobacterales bacterium]
MEFKKLPFDRCAEAEGVIVVIDVLRAFTTAAYAFSRGAAGIIPVATLDQAFALREKCPDLLLMGEEQWHPIPGFNFGNSPAALMQADLDRRWLVQRTSAGTQGLMQFPSAEALFAASFVCAKATVRAITALQPEVVSFILTGTLHGAPAEEDEACADYMAALFTDDSSDPTPWLARVGSSYAGQKFLDPESGHYAPQDVALCATVDHFPFAMRAVSVEGIMALQAVSAS